MGELTGLTLLNLSLSCMLPVNFECFLIWDSVKSSFCCNSLVFISAYLLPNIMERWLFLSDQIIFFSICESLMLLERDKTAFNLNYKVYKVLYSATYLHISKLLWKFSYILKSWKNFIVNTHTQHLDSTVTLLHHVSICALLLLNLSYRYWQHTVHAK